MFSPASMELLSVAVSKDKIEELVTHLLKLGIFHPIDIRDIEEQLKDLSTVQLEQELAQWDALQTLLRDVVRKLKLSLNVYSEISYFTKESIKKTLEELDKILNSLLEKRDVLVDELKNKESILGEVRDYLPVPINKSSLYTFLDVSLGKIEEKDSSMLERSLTGIPHLSYAFDKEGSKIMMLVIVLRRDRILIEKVLKDVAWVPVEYPQNPDKLSHQVKEALTNEITVIRNRIQDINTQISALGNSNLTKLTQIASHINLKKSLLRAEQFSCVTERTAILSGWVPRKERATVIREITNMNSACYIEEKRAEELDIAKEEIPVKLTHNKFLKPFELLIESYGVPRYGTIDPTIFVTISFLVMFGAMFGDLGHGLVLAGISLLMRRRKRTIVQASSLLLYCGISASLFGLLYGSFFGIEFASLWLKPMHDIMSIFKVSVLFGIGIITLGIIINIVNAMRDRDYLRAIFDKAGLIIGVVYWAGIGLVSKIFVAGASFSSFYLYVFLAGLAVFFAKPVAEYFIYKGKINVATSFMEQAIEILELVISYLANTISFIRIAAYSLAHASLFLVIFEISNVLKNVNFGIWSLIIIILGNALIIILEGIVASIQSLRLNYYEFFSKFFVSGKQLWHPLAFDSKK